MSTTEAKWAERVRAWRESGKTADEFASGFDFEASTLRYWASRLKGRLANGATSPMEARPKRARTRPSAVIARVVRRPAEPHAASNAAVATLEVVVGEARISVRRGFDPEVLRQVVAVLGGAR